MTRENGTTHNLYKRFALPALRRKRVIFKIRVDRQALKVTKTIGAVYVGSKGESVIGLNPQQMRVIETAHPLGLILNISLF